MEFDYVVVRSNILPEVYGAHLLESVTNAKTISTGQITSFTDEMLEKVKGKKVLIVGNYYSDNMLPILKTTSDLTVFLNSSDKMNNDFECVQAERGKGILTWILSKFPALSNDKVIWTISFYLEKYIYGWPCGNSIYFQYGIYTRNGSNDLERILDIKSMDDVVKTIATGQQVKPSLERIVKSRMDSSRVCKWRDMDVIVTFGDNPIVETCIELAKASPNGIGFLFRYNFKTCVTYFSCRVTEESGLDAGYLASEFAKESGMDATGGGGIAMGGGSIKCLTFPTYNMQIKAH